MTPASGVDVSRRPIQLHWAGGQVVVTPEDESRFVLAAGAAITACQNAVAIEHYLHQFKDQFLTPLHEWCEEQKAHVQSCYVAPLTTIFIKVFVVTRSERYDFALSDLIADLESQLGKKGWRADILQIAAKSPEEIRVFFDPLESILVYHDGQRTAASAEG